MRMFTAKPILLIATLCASSTTFASLNLHGEAGSAFTNLSASFGAEHPGMTVSGNWAHSDNDGDTAGLGLGYNFNLGPFLLTAGGKALYLNPKDGMRATRSRSEEARSYRLATSLLCSASLIIPLIPCPAA
ncbi:YfaZ [Klebsiella michiganensis]